MTDNQKNYARAKAIEKKNKQRILSVLGHEEDDDSGIYAFIRSDENGIRYAYIGKAQTQGVITRMAQHLSGYKQHIDLSLRKHGLYHSLHNPHGWSVRVLVHCSASECDKYEQDYIRFYANDGWQLRNVESGGTTGKIDINDRKPARGYRDGVAQGERNVIKKIKHLFDLHLKAVTVNPTPNKTQQKALDKFYAFLQGETDND